MMLKSLLLDQDCTSRPLPSYALIYFEHLEGKYRSLPAAQVPEESKTKLDQIVQKNQDGILNWDDLYAFDLVLSRLMPKTELPRKVWSLRNRYRDVAGLREYDAYLASRPPDYLAQITDNKRQGDQGPPVDSSKKEDAEPKDPDPAKPTAMSSSTEAALRADVEFLLTQIHLRYAIRPAWEQQREYVSRVIAVMTGVGLIALFIYALLVSFTRWSVDVTPLGAVLFTGLMGGLLSVQQRYQSASDEGDPVHNIAVLRWGNFSVLVSPFSGALFAVIFYIIFVAGLVKGDLFPAFPDSIGDPKEQPPYFSEFLRHATPESLVQYAKLIVWSFIAGFFERMVPDTLSRFAAKQNMAGKGTV
ncbi:hypothetical protein ACO0LO_04460 [Undibacterium sp. TJN25]|uniref:hypothetical protein n=1 Tax=Undibacterium sp. TJN25 TaxID=3413056 RepID=UPI003BF344D5